MKTYASDWHIWVINYTKLKYIKEYIKEHVKEVKEILCPTYTKEYRLRSGKVRKKKIPVYSSYLFLNYKDNPETVYALKGYPFIVRCIGKCYGDDLEYIRNAKEIEEINASRNVSVGDAIRVNGGALKGFNGTVIRVSGGTINANIDILGRYVDTKLDVCDVDVITKG